MVNHDAAETNGKIFFEFFQKALPAPVSVWFFSRVEVYTYWILRKFDWSDWLHTQAPGESLITQALKSSEGFCVASVPGWSKGGDEYFFHNFTQSLITQPKVLALSGRFSARAEFQFLSPGFVIQMAPTMLGPAPKPLVFTTEVLQLLPARSGKPSWNYRES
jgi:hypothetical protein